ncbi:hypothetical protein CROQUDRAFT_35311 [Cronartium quercuum f. sp. fusiforme G11]|uniref:glucan 1,3-beta-glucosidase n=1 Tax=Cronartium quercuum f. sp. fusiforme G11 TaxID=708437 RepID=A0A9P6TH60_9BASI|nr:hypothetical protein CROQUDRAFT_35311 [Cronartium quercuum f. sp. fusiforme G11]
MDKHKTSGRQRKGWIILVIVILIATVAIILGIVFGLRIRRGSTKGDPVLNAQTNSKSDQKLWGGYGDTIRTEDGSQFVYNNTLGGTWVSIPFNDTARPQSDQPALSERWDYSANRILGVNLGGWLVLEPFISPSVFEPFLDVKDLPAVVDEWTLSVRLGSQLAETVERHYQTFITEQDFAEIASAGLNWVRIPVAWWMIETWPGEPFLAGVSWKYFLKAVGWARKYGLRINLDLHAVPGSQNGWNHSGRMGQVGFLHGLMGVASSQRTLNYIRVLAEFMSRNEYKNVIPMFSVLNEAYLPDIGSDALRRWYYQVYQLLRKIGGTGEGKGPFMAIHDGFATSSGGQGQRDWDGYLKGADRLALDTHSYLAFSQQSNDSVSHNSVKPCIKWAASYNATLAGFGLAISGEYSLAVNDCGLFVNGIGFGTRYEGTFPSTSDPDTTFTKIGTCDQWLNSGTWSDATKKAFADFMAAQQDTFRNSFFWTWKIGKSLGQDHLPNPMWSYQNGLREGYIGRDARLSSGRCAQMTQQDDLPIPTEPWSGTLAPWQTGGSGAGAIDPDQVNAYSVFPPPELNGGPDGSTYLASSLPRYLPIGKPVKLSFPTATPAPSSSSDTGWYVPQDGCNYPDTWNAVGASVVTPVCGL